MQAIALTVGGHDLTYLQLALGFGASVLALLAWTALTQRSASHERTLEAASSSERAREMDDKIAEMNRLQAELTSRMQTMAEIFGSRHSDMARLLAERMDGLRSHLGHGLEASGRSTVESLQKLNERLAVIDSAQKNLTVLTGEMLTLKDILSNKQARGAYGQGRMEAIIRDGLPAAAYGFQVTLANRTRPDCVISLPGDARPLVVDAKFPLEGFTAFRSAAHDEARRLAIARVRADMGAHIKDMAEKYVAAEDTQDMALMFVPSEAIHADLHEHFEDLVQKAQRARIVIVSPSLLALAVQLMRSMVRDARMRDEARIIQAEVATLLVDVRRLGERADKLDAHFRQVSEDVGLIRTSAEKIVRRGDRIEALEFESAVPPPASAPHPAPPPAPAALRAAE
jgi:DNA recombination protein RmuC